MKSIRNLLYGTCSKCKNKRGIDEDSDDEDYDEDVERERRIMQKNYYINAVVKVGIYDAENNEYIINTIYHTPHPQYQLFSKEVSNIHERWNKPFTWKNLNLTHSNDFSKVSFSIQEKDVTWRKNEFPYYGYTIVNSKEKTINYLPTISVNYNKINMDFRQYCINDDITIVLVLASEL